VKDEDIKTPAESEKEEIKSTKESLKHDESLTSVEASFDQSIVDTGQETSQNNREINSQYRKEPIDTDQYTKSDAVKPESKNKEMVDSVVDTGKDILKGLDGFLNKAASSFNGKGESKRNGSTPRIKPRAKKDVRPGYLVCDKCAGYYQLEPGESADDFSDECECGGKLEHHDHINSTT
jgi:hypothetical protein